jgi:DNA-directed RNA polymerase sigma subunit (sigma70/sigma32)
MVFLQTIEHSLGETSMDEHEEFDHLSDKQCHVRAQLWERRIFEARRLADEQMTLEDLAAEFGVSRERERQIEWRAFEKVQSTVKQGVAEQGGPSGNTLSNGAIQGPRGVFVC